MNSMHASGVAVYGAGFIPAAHPAVEAAAAPAPAIAEPAPIAAQRKRRTAAADPSVDRGSFT